VLSRRGRRAAALAIVGIAGAAAFLVLTEPQPIDEAELPRHDPDLANGRVLYDAGSCYTCHAPADPEVEQKRLPAGGRSFATPVGTFYPQNLTPDPVTGIGRWTEADFVNAMQRGISPDGRHYFPAFPYPSFRLMRVEDVLDLHAYLMSLEAVRSPTAEAAVPFLWLARRGVGLWNRIALDDGTYEPDPAHDEAWNRGRYLVVSIGHCGECHTPRNLLMVPDETRFLAGGSHPRGEGDVPSLRGLLARKRYKDAGDLTLAMQYGETFGYDKLSSGGMGAIQENLARLPESDVRAMSDYLVSLD